MSACRYRLMHIAIEPNVQGVAMRRLIFKALPSEPFGTVMGDDEKTAFDPHAEGAISHRVTVEYAQAFQVGDEFAVIFRERKAGDAE